MSLLTAVVVLAVGLAIGLGAPDGDVAAGLGRLSVLGLMTAVIAVPAGGASSIGRGLLPGIATSVIIVVLAQVSVLADAGGWFPFVAPATWALQPGTSAAILLLVPLVPAIFGAATVVTWQRLQLDL